MVHFVCTSGLGEADREIRTELYEKENSEGRCIHAMQQALDTVGKFHGGR